LLLEEKVSSNAKSSCVEKLDPVFFGKPLPRWRQRYLRRGLEDQQSRN